MPRPSSTYNPKTGGCVVVPIKFDITPDQAELMTGNKLPAASQVVQLIQATVQDTMDFDATMGKVLEISTLDHRARVAFLQVRNRTAALAETRRKKAAAQQKDDNAELKALLGN